MKTFILAGITAIIIAAVAVPAISYPEGKITIKVTDEKSEAIQGADVGIGFSVQSNRYFGNEEVEVRGISDPDGQFIGQARGDKSLGFTIKKSGYYQTTGKFDFDEIKADRWQPWNPTLAVVLKQIGKPAPMYIRKARLEVPVVDEPIGFDLEASDWVSPHGKGTVKDFIFTLTRKWVDKTNFDVRLALSFSNPGDGIQNIEIPKNYGSELKLPRTAPEEGYQAQLSTSIGRVPGRKIQNQANDRRNHIYRVRTVLGEQGQIRSALYGKIHGDFRLDPIRSKTGVVAFTYYLNPTSLDRNLESDPKRNLFTILEPSEKVNEP